MSEIVDLNDERLEVRYGLTGYGGGRAVFARTNIAAGSIVMTEEPAFIGPDHIQESDTNLHAALARAILQASNRTDLLQHVSHLCPVCLADLPAAILPVLRHAHSSTLEHLRDVEAATTVDAANKLDDDALLRLVVAMQMNAFKSGVYVRLAMINHSCRPNCSKFAPAGSSHSEIVATRDIAPGDEIFINYLQPFGQSEARRKLGFEEQHIWDLPPSPFRPEFDALAPGQPGHGSPGFVEALKEVSELEERLDVIAEGASAGSMSPTEAAAACTEALHTAGRLLGPWHLVQVRVRHLTVDALQAMAVEGIAGTVDLVLLVKVAKELVVLLDACLGDKHCDVASVLDVLQQSMDFLMAHDRNALVGSCPEWPTFAAVSRAQYAYAKRCKQLAGLYQNTRPL